MDQNDWMSIRNEVAGRLAAVRERMANAANRSGRSPEEVTLIAVTKYVTGREGLEAALLSAGCHVFGENRPQRLLDKRQFLAGRFVDPDSGPTDGKNSGESIPFDSAQWHFIGPLQRNKVRKILPLVTLIHSVDTPELFAAINRILSEENQRKNSSPPNGQEEGTVTSLPFPEKIPVLFEVNISGEGNKHGFSPENFIDRAGPLLENPDRTIPRGLMGMGGLTSTPEEIRKQFATLRRLGESVRTAFPTLTGFEELSIGMSGDFEIAIEEGATMVRIGSLLYPDRF